MRPFWDTDIKVVVRRVKQGSIVRVHRGLYAGKEYWDRLDPHERLRHILRSLSQWHERWAFCGASAAVMHGLDCSYRQLHPIHVAVGRNSRPRNQRYVRFHVLDDAETVAVDGARVTSILRTLVDCAAMMPRRYAMAPIDSALRQGKTTVEQMLEYVMRFPCFGTGNAFVPYLPKVMEGLKTVVSRSAVPFWTNWGFLCIGFRSSSPA